MPRMRRRSKEKQEETEGQEGGSQEPEGRRKSQRGEGAEGDGAVRADPPDPAEFGPALSPCRLGHRPNCSQLRGPGLFVLFKN